MSERVAEDDALRRANEVIVFNFCNASASKSLSKILHLKVIIYYINIRTLNFRASF